MATDNPLVTANQLGQSIWIDFIQRSMLESGELAAMIKKDAITGLTSNPSIFEAAIAKTDEYDASLAAFVKDSPNASNIEIFNHLAIADIQAAADIFADVYQASDGEDGMVSLEVAPELAHDADATVERALALNEAVNRPNVMIKVPGTAAGVKAFEQLTAQGVNVNVTLLFSIQRYLEIARAYIRALESRHAAGGDVSKIASVASFFVSRVDTAIDEQLGQAGSAGDKEARAALTGCIGIANAKVAYGHFANLFGSEQWQKLSQAGANVQRLLWASTGTKNPAYRDTLYIEELLGPQTVNTVPPKTLDAFRDHGVAESRLSMNLANAHKQLSQLNEQGINLGDVTDKLEKEGLQAFADAFDRLMASIDEKRKHMAA